MPVTLSPRLGISRWSAGADPYTRAQRDSDHQKLDDLAAIDLQGTLAARPAFGIRGRYYYATDNGLVYRDTGTAWVTVGSPLGGSTPADVAAAGAGAEGASTSGARADHAHGHPVFTTGDLHSEYLRKSLADAKGDLLVATSDNNITRLAVGSNYRVPVADSAEGTGIRWGSTEFRTVRKVVDESVTSSVAMQDDDVLLIPIPAAGGHWAFRAYILTTGDPAGDIKIGFSLGAGAPDIRFTAIGPDDAAVAGTDLKMEVELGFGEPTFGVMAADSCIVIDGLCITDGGSAANLQFRWAQRVSNATATKVRFNSFMTAWKL